MAVFSAGPAEWIPLKDTPPGKKDITLSLGWQIKLFSVPFKKQFNDSLTALLTEPAEVFLL